VGTAPSAVAVPYGTGGTLRGASWFPCAGGAKAKNPRGSGGLVPQGFGLIVSEALMSKLGQPHMKARKLDRLFDAGEDITQYLGLSSARRPNQEQKRVNVDFPVWMVESLDREAKRLGVARQSLIKMLIARHIQRTPSTR